MSGTIAEIVEQMNETGIPETVARNTAAQFGTPDKRYLGATLLPEREVPENTYDEEAVRFRTVVASDGSRYSPVQRRGADLYATFSVRLAHSDIGADMTAQQYEALMRYLERDQSQNAVIAATRWLDIRINRALVENAEKQRWECIVDGQVIRTGDGDYRQVIDYRPNPASDPQRIDASALPPWSDRNTDIFQQLHDAAQLLIDNGYEPGRMVTSRRAVNQMALNNTIKARGGITVVDGSSIETAPGRAQFGTINALLQDDGLPPFETYDQRFRTVDGHKRFMPENCICIFARVERDMELDLGDANIDDLIPMEQRGSLIGYHAIGKAAGQPTPGRVIQMYAFTNKPPRVEAEGWTTHLPVLQHPQAFVILKNLDLG